MTQSLDYAPPQQAVRRTPWWKSALKWLLFIALIIFVGRALWRQIDKLDWRTLHFHPIPLLAAAIVLAIVYAARTISFRILLAGYDVRLTWREAAIVGWIPQIGKYIPGQVASLAGAVALLRRFKTPGPIALAVVLVMDGLAVLTGLITGSPLLLWAPVKKVLPHGWLWCGLLVIAGIVSLHPRVYGWLLNLALKKFRRAPLTRLPPWHNYIGPVLLGFAQWILAGVALWLIARSITFVNAEHLPLFIAIAGLGYTVSYLAVFAPGGLGVREAIFQGTLFLIISTPAAIVVITMRIVQTLIEIIMALAGWVLLSTRSDSS
ncbi:lysylphosphatidylglycerol synthase transmembrane domain-containing protein [soil metagenome]